MRFLLKIVLALLSIVVLFASLEFFYYLSGTLESAKNSAFEEFNWRLSEEKLKEDEYVGPELITTRSKSYVFVWRNEKKGKEILVLVSYLPFYTQSWYGNQ